jgi:hypothetical protein
MVRSATRLIALFDTWWNVLQWFWYAAMPLGNLIVKIIDLITAHCGLRNIAVRNPLPNF